MKLYQNILAFAWMTLVSVGLLCIGCQRAEPIPGIVQGTSMAPHWLGEHQRLTCDDCQYPIRFELNESDALTRQIVCPNCGYAKNPLAIGSSQAAQRVSIHHSQPISRWDVVAARLPNSNRMGIKRVVGMPGDRLQFRHGELLVNGAILVKPREVQTAVRIPVYDSTFQMRRTNLPRWIPDDPLDDWSQASGVWHFQASVNQAEIDLGPSATISPLASTRWSWLTYQHWRCCAHRGQRQDPFPLEDIDTFNPSLPRALHSMVDFSFELMFTVDSESELGWRIYRGGIFYECQLDVDRNELMLIQGVKQTSQSAEIPNVSAGVTYQLSTQLIKLGQANKLEVSTFDNQLSVRINDTFLVERPLPDPVETTQADFLQIGARTGSVEWKQFRMWRDIYYFPDGQADFQVPADSYFLLGDNVPVSHDSRHWQPAAVSRKNILGIVKPVDN